MNLQRLRRWPGWLILPAFFIVNLFLRWAAFPQSVIDWDESIYLLVARSMLDGQVPYVAIWDHKPPGLYTLFALALMLFGRSVLAIRLLAVLAVTVSCYLLWRLGRDGLGSATVGLLAGLFYAIFSLPNGGYATNAEILFAPFVILSFYWLWAGANPLKQSQGKRPFSLLLIGLSLGLALQVKYVTAFELLAVIVLLTASPYWGARKRFGRLAVCNNALILSGAALPFVAVVAYFALTGHLSDYIYANFTANLIYEGAAEPQLMPFLRAMKGQLQYNLLLWVAVLAAPLLLTVRNWTQPRLAADLAALGTWLGFAFVGVIVTGRFYWHYFLQLTPPLSLIAAYAIINGLQMTQKRSGQALGLVLTLLITGGLISSLWRPVAASLKTLRLQVEDKLPLDLPATVAAYLNERLDGTATIYVVDYEPVVYFLTNVEPPTRYVSPPLLTDNEFGSFAGVEPLLELEAIMARHPAYVLLRKEEHDSPFYSKLWGYLDRSYALDTVIGDVLLFRRKAAGAEPTPERSKQSALTTT